MTAAAGGRAAVLQAGGVKVILTSQLRAFTEANDFLELGLDPSAHDLTVVKLGYLFPDLQQVAGPAFMALTPGASDLDIPRLPFERVQRPLYPLDPNMADPTFDIRVFPD